MADISCIKRVARRSRRPGGREQVVVVVSARAGVTNELIERAKAIRILDREMDVLMTCGEQELQLFAMAPNALSKPAVSALQQAGITTEGMHSKARIRRSEVETFAQPRAGMVVVVAGFQGINDKGDMTTFGRGGSDLAIALAGALKAKSCQIFTDVEGVFTADPRTSECLQDSSHQRGTARVVQRVKSHANPGR